MTLEVLFLGSGTSHGVPMIGCSCPVCLSSDPRDKRNRPSILLSSGGRTILVDTPPELRLACIREGVTNVDAVIFTHHHADHIMGLDDIRRFNAVKGGPVSCYGAPITLDEIRKTFRYAFGSQHYGGGLPVLNLVELDGLREIEGIPVEPLTVLHGPTEVTALRIGSFAYVTDVKSVPGQTLERLKGLDTLVLGVLRHRPHPTHLSVTEALDLLDQLQPRRAYFTHIAHDLGHQQTEDSLPENVFLACDGLRLKVEV